MRSIAAPETTPLTEVDAGFVYFAQPGKSFSIHVEVHVAGHFHPERLLYAALAACERHPLARARMVPFHKGDRIYRWEIQDHASALDLEVVDCVDGLSLAHARHRLLEIPPRLDLAPPFKLGLAHRPEGDVLILIIHHAACDGLGAWRLMTSILRSYAGVEDPVPAFDPLRARELRPLVVPDTRRERLRRLSKLPALLASSSRPVCIAPHGTGGGGEGVCLLSFDERETAAVEDRRRGASTMNDVMLAGLALAIRRWNDEHGARSGRICLTVPVNLRPPSWSDEVLGNFASFIPVSIPKADPSSLDGLVAAVTKRTQRAKKDHTANALFDMLPTLLRWLPVTYKQRLGLLMPKAVERLQDTAILSNLGRLALPDLGGEAGLVRAAWASPPAGFTRGFAVLVFSLDGRLHVALRYHQALFDGDAAAAFAELYREALLAEDDDGPL